MSGSISLRTAGLEDSETLRGWRNDALTMSMSKNDLNVTRTNHDLWMGSVIADPYRHLLVAERDRNAVGTVRFDVKDGVAELSLTVAPTMRNQGLGNLILSLALEWAWEQLTVGLIAAEVKRTNRPSIKIFERCGFSLAGNQDPLLYQLRRDKAMQG